MARLIEAPALLRAAGTPPKEIREYVGRVNSATSQVSVAIMNSPEGWTEPGQTPQFNEYTVVLKGSLHVQTRTQKMVIGPRQAVCVEAGEWVQYSTPEPGGAEYLAVCVPAFSPETVHRDSC